MRGPRVLARQTRIEGRFLPIEDLRTIGTASPIDADLCLVGSGFAAWSIAEELRESGLRIVVIESGGLGSEAAADALNEVDDVGVPLRNGRDRLLGGTSHTWTGRCRAFDEIDYERRSWVPHSGWPLDGATIAPYLDRAAEHLGAGPYTPDGRAEEPPGPQERPRVDPGSLQSGCWEDPPPVRIGPRFLANTNAKLRVIVHATVTHLTTDPSGAQLESVEIACDGETRTTVRARAFVLCAGGIENARLLLSSNRVRPNGIGNEHDVVGRYLMDHPRDNVPVVGVDVRHAARVRALFGPYKRDGARGRHDYMHGLAFAPERQRRDGLLNCAAWPREFSAADDPIDAATRLATGRSERTVRDLAYVVTQPGWIVSAVRAKRNDERVAHKLAQIGFTIASEQVPDPESRVRLGSRKDRFGVPIVETDWRVNAREKASQAELARTIAREFERLGLPRATLAPWTAEGRHDEAIFADGCHPTGTTRMATDPRFGVVDADCRVHGVEGLYVAGSSIFPTAGHANPTLTIVAFAIRLAHLLRRRLSATLAADVVSVRPPGDEVAVARYGTAS